ncbi:MAG: 30S ribosomal protein S12 methylthiotransferase RimO [Pirellulaceae bacterium]|nr:30S ribosomal protein S12 methylthiotransferase RimO [Pirellulaceae bacterium]
MTTSPAYDSNIETTKGTYAFVSLGCPKNLVDSERMLGLLDVDGYQVVTDPDGADFVVVNTCGFIEQARQESYGVIREMLELKRAGRTRGVIVSGCLAERQKEKLLEELPQIDHLVGVFGRDEITRVADRLVGRLDEQRSVFRPAPITALSDRQRLRITPRHFAYLKISEGCDRLCTFCAIPKMRGKHISKTPEQVIQEAEELAADGVRELNIVAQDTPYYGIDLFGEPRLAELLEGLEQVAGIEWIRLMYFYPMYVTDAVIDTIAQSDKIVPYLDMPLQHIHDEMLKRMARRVSRKKTEELLGKLRERIPGLALRTTMITGFPGETDEHFETLADFVRKQKFERLGAFTYSLEPDTPAASLPGHLPETVKEARRDTLMEIQQQNAFAWNQQQIGRQVDVLIDLPVEGQPNAWIGRWYVDAPDIDSVTYVTGDNLAAGQIVRCEIVDCQQYDLIAAAIDTPR